MLDFKIHYYAVLNSTNDTAKEMATGGAPEGSVVIADRQETGRGRQGNSWVSPEGNLYMSVILREAVSPKEAGQISFIAAVALADVLKEAIQPEHTVQQKWPNDVWVDGKKISGILLESEYSSATKTMDWVVLGIGVNLNAAPEGAICLNDLSASKIDRDRFAKNLLEALKQRLNQWREHGFHIIQKDWLADARALNEEITVRLPQETLRGEFQGIDENGCLLLIIDGIKKKIASGDVFFE